MFSGKFGGILRKIKGNYEKNLVKFRENFAKNLRKM